MIFTKEERLRKLKEQTKGESGLDLMRTETDIKELENELGIRREALASKKGAKK